MVQTGHIPDTLDRASLTRHALLYPILDDPGVTAAL